MEKITENETGRWLRFENWDAESGLFQGVTVKSPGGWGMSEEQVRELADGKGFSTVRRLRQVHGSRVVSAEEGHWSGGNPPEADGIIGSLPGVLGLITVADCVPVFLFERGSGSWGLLHAGWRGVESGVLTESLNALRALKGCSAENVEFYLGPAICGNCYEIGPEVAQRLIRAVSAEGLRPAGEKYYADLRRLLPIQAEASGVKAGNIFTSAYCTRCHNELFHSWRAEGQPALRRMWAFLGRL
ncbi:MAG: hypothetical protein A3F83_12820 [Candidatus Glassbacteria bacterium RIFCSPLOWO2_12_FULL_58_11]|uniref:Purine nucleoside phosphorylase n=1 Tax=Candidatus Glassbacteria bacterium RIFCSPLOWO2_12_FULL_58_11 TaxID=1817867 RepID=A0A1F5YLK8_9BACT|nr:MAG: hypothetical protein A3F83_12820 [Candidatus Glassbacteria bacterium RIFCSPLOWO2_12_FULL_58_11]